LEETCAWVTYCFAEKESEKQKALQIMKGLKTRSPEDWYQKVISKYGDFV